MLKSSFSSALLLQIAAQASLLNRNVKFQGTSLSLREKKKKFFSDLNCSSPPLMPPVYLLSIKEYVT